MIRIGDYYFDAALSESHEIEAEITEHPVEKGSPITDNRRRLPKRVTIEFGVSDTPIGEAYTRRAGALALEEEGLVDKVLPSKEAREYLEKLDEDSEPVSISTNLRDYGSMLVESISIDVTPDTDGSLQGTIVFKQVRIVENRRVRVVVALPRAGKKVKRGPVKSFEVIGDPLVDGATGKKVIDVRAAPGERGQFWYTNEDSPFPARPMDQDEIDAMNAYDQETHDAAYHDGRNWIDSRTGEPIPESAVPAGRYQGDPEDLRNKERVGEAKRLLKTFGGGGASW